MTTQFAVLSGISHFWIIQFRWCRRYCFL